MIPTTRRAKAMLDFLALGGWFEASSIQETDEALAAFSIFFEQCDPLTAHCNRLHAALEEITRLHLGGIEFDRAAAWAAVATARRALGLPPMGHLGLPADDEQGAA